MGGPVRGERCLRVHAGPITCPRPSGRVLAHMLSAHVAAALLLQRHARAWLRCRKKLRRKQRSRAAKIIQRSVRTWLLLLRVVAKPYTASTAASSGSEGADGEELVEPPEPEATEPPSTEPASTDCVICWDGDAEYAAVPCGHRCLCANCSQTVSECPVCRAAMTAVLRVFV